MKKRTRGLAVATLTLALAVPTAFTGPASADQRIPSTAAALDGPRRLAAPDETQDVALALPRPTGDFAVGRDTLHLVDEHRKDPWVPTADRELMLSLYYPAKPGTGGPARYMTEGEARALIQGRGEIGELVTPEQLSATRTHAREDARPARGKFPLVVLSPGYTVQRSTLTTLAEELASHGYVVAAIDHAYESDGTSFPQGRLLTCVSCAQTGSLETFRRVADGRAEDVSFVLDNLTGPKATWHLARTIDDRRIGMAGHSIGGASTAATMTTDPRVRAGVNMDGTFFSPIPPSGLNGRPFLMLGDDPELRPPGFEDPTWEQTWQRLDGWKRWLTVTKAGHFSFTDWPVLGEQLGYQDPKAPLSGTRSQEITRAYVDAFFQQHLRRIPQPLLNGPSPAHPEVVFFKQADGLAKQGRPLR